VTMGGDDTYSFQGSTFNGPTAVGSNARAWTDHQHPQRGDRRYDELRRELSEFQRHLERCMSTMEPLVARQFSAAVEEVVEELDRRPVHPDRLRGRVQRLAAIGGSIAGLAAAADRIRQWLAGAS
jgi:hypothetical protein